jgi:hypothetical protein
MPLPPISSSPIATQAPAPIPFPPGGKPVGPAPTAGMPMPGMPGMPGGRVDPRMQELERRLQEQEEARKKLENKTRDLELQLKDEHEKVILGSLKAKEEESLSVRVEQQLREMQEKLRREKYEQELQDSRGKAENQLKEMERRIGEERETWMTALKNQLKEREVVEREVETNLNRRIHDLEQRYLEERNQWTLSLRQKEEDLSQERRRFQLETEKWKEALEEREEQVKDLDHKAERELHERELRHQAEIRALQAQLEANLRDTGAWKAQIAMAQSQATQMETQFQQDRSRFENQARHREEQIKREYEMREQERSQYWENVLGQLKSEKEALRNAANRQQDEVSRLLVEISEVKRVMEVERGEWQSGLEKARRIAKEEALRDLPVEFEERLDRERKKLIQEHMTINQSLQLQIVKMNEAQKALQAKFDIETRRWAQQRESMEEAQKQQEADLASTRESLAVTQTQRAELENRAQELSQQIVEHKADKDKMKTAIAASLQDAYAKEEQMKTLEQDMENLKSKIGDFLKKDEEHHAKEELWKSSQAQLTAAFHNVQKELAELQTEHNKREADWKKTTEDWDRVRVELEKAVKETPAQASVSADGQKALASIKQQMQELRTVLAGLRPNA